jgi:hypothetical protein
MDAKQHRQQFGKHYRTSIYAAHSRGASAGMGNSVVMVLDLRDQLARDLAASMITSEQLARKTATSRHTVPKLVAPMTQADAANLLGTRSRKAAKLVQTPVGTSRFRAVIIGYGGMTCTDLQLTDESSPAATKTTRKPVNVASKK